MLYGLAYQLSMYGLCDIPGCGNVSPDIGDVDDHVIVWLVCVTGTGCRGSSSKGVGGGRLH